jgi:heat shock protein HslJ
MGAAAYRIGFALSIGVAFAGIASATPALDGTKWHVKAINSHVTPAKADYHVDFKDGRINARFGCNSISGSFKASSDKVTLGELVSTKMACGAPAAAFEEAALGILHRPMKVAKSSKGRLRLSNRVGSIDLEPRP